LNAIAFNNTSINENINNEVVVAIGSLNMQRVNKVEILKLKQANITSQE
jgi:hypothetical protein